MPSGGVDWSFRRNLPISVESQARITASMVAQGFPLIDESCALGNVSFHSGWLFHHAAPNTSPVPRSVMTIIYIDSRMRLAKPTNAMQAADRAQCCPGIEASRPVASRPISSRVWFSDNQSLLSRQRSNQRRTVETGGKHGGSSAHSPSIESLGKATSARAYCTRVVSVHIVDLWQFFAETPESMTWAGVKLTC